MRGRFLKDFYLYVDTKNFHCGAIHPWGPWFDKMESTLPTGSHTSFRFPGELVFERIFLFIFLWKNSTSPPLHCGPTLLLRIMLLANLNQHTLRMLNTYYSFSSQIVFERRFLKIKKKINNSLLSPLNRECGPSSLHLIMHWAVFGLKWLSGSGEIENVKC